MTSAHDRMTSDYIWIRDHSAADAGAKARTHGYNYLYYHAPNKRERLEMMYRSMGKAHDWELEKFRLGKKFPDRGNKKRLFKNMFRLFKNPAGYLFWKSYKYRTAKGRIMATTLGLGFMMMFMKYKQQSYRTAKKNYFLLRSGKNVESTGTTDIGYNHNQLARQAMPLTQFLYYDLPGSKIVVNPCRNQNFRKYFDIRKKYGIKPPNYVE